MNFDYFLILFILVGFIGGLVFGFYGGCSMCNDRVRKLLMKVDNYDPTKSDN